MSAAGGRFRCVSWLLLAAVLASAGRAETTVFRAGKVLLPVVVAVGAAPEERAAAAELARVLGRMSGLDWPVAQENTAGADGFFVGRTRAAAALGGAPVAGTDLLDPRPGETGPDGFRIRARAGRVLVEAATPEGTGFAVAWLLQREAGVRWYVPGPLGETVPRRTEWTLRDLDVTVAPAYRSREIYELRGEQGAEWARRNGLRGRLDYGHALSRIFPPETLAAQPEWAPLVRGARYLPATTADYHWQPNLALPEVAAFAAKSAAVAFDREPGRASFSLGINDTVRFDQSAATRALVEPVRHFRGLPDYSPLVFTFMNRAAEAVAATGPGRYLGCLAYFWCEAPPPFPVRPEVVPYLTTDRGQYYDAAYRAADHALMSKWSAAGVRAYGLWEYAGGTGFVVPRQPLDAWAEGVREGWRRGARGYFVEVGPHWGFDAFKVWMLARLLWEPELSPKELANDFYPGFYGAAAEPMRRFFGRCESLWLAQPGPPFWLKFYQQEDQIALFPPPAMAELRALLNEAERAVSGDPSRAARVGLTSQAFGVTEAFGRFDAVRRELAGPDDSAAADPHRLGELIGRVHAGKREVRARFAAAVEGGLPAMTSFPLETILRNDPVPRRLWLAGQADPAAPAQMVRAAGVAEVVAWRRLAQALADGSLAAAENLAGNPFFAERAEAGADPDFLHPRDGARPAVWQVQAMSTETGRVARVSNGPAARALRIEGAWDTQVFQWLPAEPGRLHVATGRLRGASSPGNDAGLFLSFLTKERTATGEARMQLLPKGESAEWRTQILADVAPADAAWVGVGVGASRQGPADWLEAAAVELRAVAPPMPVLPGPDGPGSGRP